MVVPDLAQEAIQAAVDACAAAGGGTVLVPPGDYTSGTIHLRSHVRLYVEAGATVYSLHDKSRFDKDALLYGEDLVGVTIEGRGVFDGEAGYDRRLKGDHEDDFIRPNQVEMEALGLPLLRSFPKPDQTGKMVLLVRCTDVSISGVSFLNSPSWTIHPVACERLVIEGVFIYSSLKDGVTAVQAPGAASGPAVVLRQVEDALIRDCRAAEGTGTFLLFSGEGTKYILLERNDFRKARLPYSFAAGSSAQALKMGY